jgi:CBS domain containing-hemolysin-like protein
VGLLLLGLTLYMSTLAYALRDYSRSRLSERLNRNGSRRWLDWLEEHESQLQGLTGFVRVAAITGVVICVYAWYLQDNPASQGTGFLLIPPLIALVLLLPLAVGIPHALALHVADSVVSASLHVLIGLRTVLWPIAWSLGGLEFITRRLLGKAEPTEDDENERLEQEILEVVQEGEAAGAVDEDQVEIIESVFRLDDTAVSEIMTPRTDLDAVQAEATFDVVRNVILSGGHSRIPVYEETVDHIIGVLYAKDLLRLNAGDKFDARQVMRVAPYVPETKSIADLLDDFRETKVQVAIVLDEYGGTAGLVTIEDILEELVGEIDDEYDQQPAPAIDQVDPDTLEVDGRVHVDEINEALDINLPEEEDYDTIGGFVFSTLGKIPTAGEEFNHDNVHFAVLAAEPRKITRLRIHVAREARVE